MQTKHFDVICHLPWRSPRQIGRRVLILPDGNGRIATNLAGYAAGADNVVACAEHFAQRGDVDTLVFCIVSDLNAQKRSAAFFEALTAQFARLRTNIVTKGHLIRHDIRCRVLGNLESLRHCGGARTTLVEEAEGVAEATNSVIRPLMHVEFWFAYSEDIAWQSDVDLVVRTGAEEAEVVRPGMSLPPNVPCIVTPTLWPEALPAQIGALVDYALRDHVPQFAPGYDLDFVEKLRRLFPEARIPAPVDLTIPVCAPETDVLALLRRFHENAEDGFPLGMIYNGDSGEHVFGPRDDLWYRLRLVPAVRWPRVSSESFHAILAPGQHAGTVRLAMPAGQAHVHSCVATADDVIVALNRAIHFPVKHVLLQGADRSQSGELKMKSPWSARLLDLMNEIPRQSNSTVEQFVRARMPKGKDTATEREWLIEGISAKVLARALTDGLLLPDENIRQNDRNHAYAGAYMMLRIPDEANTTEVHWEPAAEVAIRCMLAISTGNHGIFHRVYPGETTEQWRNRRESSAQFLTSMAQSPTHIAMPKTRDARLLRAIGAIWQELLGAREEAHPELVPACRDALRRHYLANMLNRSTEVVDNPLVHWLCIGGLPRREAFREIENRYARTTPAPIAAKIRALLAADVIEEKRFQSVRREMKLLLYLADTAHSIGMEVLFLFGALTTPPEYSTAERLQALMTAGRIADYAFRLANDVARLNDGFEGDQNQNKESVLAILIPDLQMARELGRTKLAWLEGRLSRAIQELEQIWPSMATKVRRVIQMHQGIYAEADFTTFSSEKMMLLLHKLDGDVSASKTSHETIRPAGASNSPARRIANQSRSA